MALFNKLFSKRKHTPVPPSPRNVSDFPFSTDQVRVLLFRECETPRLLFDSDSIQHVERPVRHVGHPSAAAGRKCGAPPSGNIVEISDGIIYKKKDQGSDCGSLAEMIFGTVAMAFRGTSLKVHWLQSPPRILCSQVFFTPLQVNTFLSTDHSDLSSGDTSSVNSVSLSFSLCVENNTGDTFNRISHPLDVPSSATEDGGRLNGTYSACDSGYSGTDPWNTSVSSYCPMSSTRSSFGSVYSDQEGTSLRKLSIDSSIVDSGYSNGGGRTSDGSLQRRILRNISTSFENRQSMSDFIGYIEDNYPANVGMGSEGSVSSRFRRNSEIMENRSKPEMVRRKTASGDGIAAHIPHHLQRQSARKARLGLAVCIKLSDAVENDMKTFCSEHTVLLEAMLCRLRAAAETAYNNRQNFFQTMFRAWHATSQWITDLFTAPRLMNPVWLTLSNGNSNKPSKLAHFFMDELCSLLTSADTKDTNFFISTLLTAILTHHLGWVGTVAPLSMPLAADADVVQTQERAKMSEISRRHPYNALWAQLGDLFGAIGSPPKISKTVVSGNCSQMVDKVLNVLTYFIRCGEIQRDMCEPTMVKDAVDGVMENLECHTVTLEELDEGRDETAWRRFEMLRELSRSESVRSVVENKPKGGMSRSMTHVKDLSGLPGGPEAVGAINSHKMQDIERKNVMNDIPNVLVYRDSRFVRQELRIGNHLMDTGIEMNPKFKNDVRSYQVKSSRDPIKFMITSADSKEFSFMSGTEEKLARVDEIEEQQEVSSVESVSLGAIRKTSMSFASFGVSGATAIEQGVEIGEDTIENHQRCFREETDKSLKTLTSCKSLSDLITENSFGQSGRLLWGVEPVKENLTIEEIKHRETREKPDVVFVLGDNEELVGLKRGSSSSSVDGMKVNGDAEPSGKKKVCNHKYKKHSGVKFNFEQYPQIAKTYMRNKNLDITDANFEKLLKMRDVKLTACEAGTSSMGSLTEEENECECCLGGSGTFLQTPSNASELEFSSEDNNYNTPPASEVASGSRKSKDKAENGGLEDAVKIVSIPMPQSAECEMTKSLERKAMSIAQSGFVPSLMTGISDHYISDMVLQGTLAPAKDFEGALKTDLTLASHCATLEQVATENVAIVANTDKWGVSVLSSKSAPGLPTIGSDHPVVMSPLVASMLETVQAMWRAGASPYQCMSFMESKLQEMYMHSETLAAFLLATDFCSMSSVTKALNLAADDVPLLMSVATVHSPQVAKKYGVSFR
ncbi:folliculin-interacting protein 1 isoform X3 [Phlebotomus argentipes]|uniref:folliculin-interacting protein 1 isoform X3 n=1 Tax=Phlebotomus argentipes TaxID=94469 RepID=UPI002892D6F1|nr:folliculin-interacting protein 1 isoform X3 [Phlebotomus argentipes]